MGKEMTSIFPKDVLSEPVTVTIGGYDDPGEPLAPYSQADQYQYALDELKSWYRGEAVTVDIPENVTYLPTDSAGRTIDPSKDAKKHKKKEKQKEAKKKMIQRLWNNEKEEETDEMPLTGNPVFPPAIRESQGFLQEHDLYRILTNEYLFGLNGSELYVRGSNGVYSPVNERTVEKLLMSTLTEEQKEKFKISTSRGVLRRLRASEHIGRNQLIVPKTKVLLANGCFDLLTKKPAEIEDSDFFAFRIDARYLPGEKLLCPNFDHYLETSSGGDESIKRRICAMLGYLMLPGYPGKRILVLGTAKDSGKSMISRFYQRLVGPELVCAQTPFDMSESHALAEFYGKIANLIMDLAAMVIKPGPVGTMKTLSGGDLISINPKGQDRRSMFCFTKQVIGTNSSLRLQQYDEAFWERLEIIPYICSISPEDRIDNLENLLFEERDAIVTKCLKEARRLIKNGYQFPACPVAEEMKDSWIGWQAQAKNYLLEHCVKEKGGFTSSTLLYRAYQHYCNERNLPCGTQTGFIRFAKTLFGIPLNESARTMIDGEQLRGLPDVRFLGEL